MKEVWKRFTFVLTLLLLLCSIGPTTAMARERASVSLWINGSYMEPDVPPFIEYDRTYVPMRFISEALGYGVDWLDETREVMVRGQGRDILLQIGEPIATINGTAYPLDAPPMIVEDRTFVPLRFIAESLGYEVDWDPDGRTAVIGSGYVPAGYPDYPSDTQPGLISEDLTGEYYLYDYLGYDFAGDYRYYDVYSKIYIELQSPDYYKIIRTDEEVNGLGGFTTVSYAAYYPQGGYLEISEGQTTASYGIFSGFYHYATEGGYNASTDEITIGELTYQRLAN